MKRSEMVNYLADELYGTSIDRTEEQCKATADFILSLIEIKGMVPPAIMTGAYYSRESAGHVEEFEHKWETEDEKN